LASIPSQVEVAQVSPPHQMRHFSVAVAPDEMPPPLPRRANTVSSSGSGSFHSAKESQSQSPKERKRIPPLVQPKPFARLPGAGIQAAGGKPESPSKEDEAPPPLPPRRVETNMRLMDEIGDALGEVDGWKPLIP